MLFDLPESVGVMQTATSDMVLISGSILAFRHRCCHRQDIHWEWNVVHGSIRLVSAGCGVVFTCRMRASWVADKAVEGTLNA